MKIRNRIMALLLSMTMIVTSAGVIAFADDSAAQETAEQTAAEELIGDTEEALEAPESAFEDIEVESVELPAVTEEEAQAEEEAAAAEDEGVVTGGSSAEEAAEAPAAGAAKMLTYSAAGIHSKVKKSLSNYRSILIAGIDNGGRADLIIVFSYNKKTKKAKVVTVTRDTYMQLNNKKKYTINGKKRDFCKCNQAAEYGGMNTLIKELNRHLDLNIREYIAVDWDCTATLIDTLGGLDLALRIAAEKAGIDRYTVKNYPKEKDTWTQLSELFGESDDSDLDLLAKIRLARKWKSESGKWSVLNRMEQDIQYISTAEGLQARMPFVILGE